MGTTPNQGGGTTPKEEAKLDKGELRGLYQDKHVKIYVDSAAALLAIKNPQVNSKTVLNCINDLNIAGGLVASLELSWVRAHF